MRLKTLRKIQPVFETEGALVRGSRITISNNELRSPRHRTNRDENENDDDGISDAVDDGEHSPPPPTEVTSFPSDQINETLGNQQPTENLIIQDTCSQTTDMTSYKAIEAAYLEHGIRIRLTPNKSSTTNKTTATTGRRSANSQRHLSFTNRNPSRTSSVLTYAPTRPEIDQETRSFSALHQASANGFETSQTLNVSLAQSSSTQYFEGTKSSEYFSTSFIAKEHSNPVTPPGKTSTHQPSAISLTFPNDPDLAYMSSLLKTSIGQSYRETIRRRAGLRDTFAVHRHPVYGPSTTSREKSPSMFRPSTSIQRNSTISVAPSSPSPEKIDKDIIKHASRLRLSHIKEFPRRSPAFETISRINSSKSHLMNRPTQKNFKSISLEPLEILLSQRFPRSSSLSFRPSPSTNTRLPETTSTFRTKSGQNHHSESLTSMKTFPTTNFIRQSGSFDSGYYDQSSNGGDFQSLTSSSLLQAATNTIPPVRLNSSTTRRSNATKKVSFYEDPSATLLRTTTYV